jgi:hypothetical protein
MSLRQDILFDYNVQHDCFAAECEASGTKASKQERKDSGKTEKIIEHKSPHRFVVNTHGFHNAHLLRSVEGLKDLIKPKPLYPDSQQHRRACAESLRLLKNQAGPDAGENETLQVNDSIGL